MPSPPYPTFGGPPIDPDLLPPQVPDSESTTPPEPRKRRRVYMHRPAKSSLYDLLHQHAGTSLFVRPIFWTDQHTELLGARFNELAPCDHPHPTVVSGSPPSRGHMRPSRAIITLSEALTEILLPSTPQRGLGSHAVKTVLSTLWPEPFGKSQLFMELQLFFCGRVYPGAARTPVMWNFPTTIPKDGDASFKSVSTQAATSFGFPSTPSSPTHDPTNLPMMCYIGKNQLQSMRANLFRIPRGPNNSWNHPVHRLQQLRAKMLIPNDDDQDAHLVGIFLAMAQRHFYRVPPGALRAREIIPWTGIPARSTTFHDVKLRILTHDSNTAEFLVYTTIVTAAFLQRFHDPFNVPVDEKGEVPRMDIEYTRVPIWPILGLRERLGTALGQELVGSFDPNDVETWESDVEQPNKSKRKREALDEVFNESFDDDMNDGQLDEPVLGGKKRCLNERGAVGVVI